MMKRSIGLALVAAAASLVASQADASPTFQLLIQSGASSASYSAAADTLDISNLSVDNFTINSLHANYSLGPVITNFNGSVTHTSTSTSPIKLTLTLAGLTNLGEAIYTDDFDGTFASDNPGNIAKLNVFFGKSAFKTSDEIFATGKVRPTESPTPPCDAPNGSTFSCSFYDPSLAPAWATYSITQVVTLYFAASTNGGTSTFNNHLADPIPEPGALGLMLSGLLVAAGLGFRQKRAAA